MAGKLTDSSIKKFIKDDERRKTSDGSGLNLEKHAKGSLYWRLAYRYLGKQKTLALGVYPTVTLKKARELREESRALIAEGLDPSLHKREQKHRAKLAAENSFEAVARSWVSKKSDSWSELTARNVLRRLELDIFPHIGHRPINEVDAPELLSVIERIEKRGLKDMPQRLRGYCSQIFRYAISRKIASSDPAHAIKEAVKSTPQPKHYAHISENEIAVFMIKLNQYQGDVTTVLGLKLMLLAFPRTSELISATWSEIDFDKREWRISNERMKNNRNFIIPLSHQATEIFLALKSFAGESQFVFPKPNKSGHMSNNAMLYAMYRMGYHSRATVHGFRALASTVLNEKGYHTDWIERQLSHIDKNKVRASYNHAQYMQQRRQMMQDWADFIDEKVSKAN